MAKFKFYAEQKCVLWWRSVIEVEADSEDKAREVAIANAQADNLEDLEIDSEIMADTIHDMIVEDNQGLPTLELLTTEGDAFWDNKDGEIPL